MALHEQPLAVTVAEERSRMRQQSWFRARSRAAPERVGDEAIDAVADERDDVTCRQRRAAESLEHVDRGRDDIGRRIDERAGQIEGHCAKSFGERLHDRYS